MRQGDGNLNCLSSVSWFLDCFQLVCESQSQCALMRSIEFVVHGRFNLEPFPLVFAKLFRYQKNPNLKSIPSRMMPTNENMYRREIFFPSALQCLFFIDQKTFAVAPKNTFRHGTKPTTKCFSRLRLNILGFLYLISFFPPFSSRVSFEKWYFDFRNNGNYVWHNL